MAVIKPERDLEEALITKLRELKYEYRPDICNRATLEANFREKFEALNRVKLTDGEFERLLDEIVTPDVYAAAQSLRNREAFVREDGTPLNYTLVNVKDWCKNTFEVVNQLRINTDNSYHRYDVILLINGVPVVQIELKALGISPRRAMQQIVDYKNDPGNGYTRTLLCFVQLFIVSNRTDTQYFANNNDRHFAFDADERFLPIYRFAAEDNSKIAHLDDFADRFLAKCTLAHMISKYMVLIASERKLLMMRPYQIYAVKAIVDCIDQNCGNGYIWHTTGSGKTLTSFKASTLLKTNESIHKCLFVVDRKDLDRQTREEFNRFQENCVEENTNTAALVRRLQSGDYADKVIVTTISYRDLEAMMTERGVAVDHSTIYRWVQRFAPEMEKRLRWQWRRPQSRSWRIDETYIKVRGKWAYLYRALDKLGNTIDFYLSATRNTKAAKRFLGKALRGLKEWEQPEVLNTDKAPTYAAAIAELKAEGKCPKDTRHRQVKYLNNVIEADHGKLKLLIRPVRGFKTLKTAYATIKGFEVMRALRKDQAGIFNFQGGIVGEARIIERAFGLGPCALTEAVALLQDRLANAES